MNERTVLLTILTFFYIFCAVLSDGWPIKTCSNYPSHQGFLSTVHSTHPVVKLLHDIFGFIAIETLQ